MLATGAVIVLAICTSVFRTGVCGSAQRSCAGDCACDLHLGIQKGNVVKQNIKII
ncbi:MAG: hypothetical protein EMLJLAPB_00468 [Candidatus Argoarchaeum ethanivorans]|uniref:Uncharacterized protein n=1 Tax=Candidatus Argoarchaeum ethanivorans TaxID=2608793 RepID=A0A811TBR8_9EURY|nr:MAG: hypothetical protein EMLJLAPB_00468 [Candidatus Argoarchaeum ethanivorans]